MAPLTRSPQVTTGSELTSPRHCDWQRNATTLTVTAAGLGVFNTLNIGDTALDTSVTFNDSAANTYTDDFSITLDNATVGPAIAFSGATTFGGASTLTASTTNSILVNTGASVTMGTGALSLTTTTGGSITFNGAVTSGGAVNVSTGAGAGDVLFSNPAGLNGAMSLGVTAGTGDVVFTGAVGSGTPLTSVTIASAKNVTFMSTVQTTGVVTQTAGTGTTTFKGTSEPGRSVVRSRLRQTPLASIRRG